MKHASWRNLFWMGVCTALLLPVAASGMQTQEYFTTTPLVEDGLLLVGSSDWSGRQGRLRALDLGNPLSGVLWDAADRVPLPGTGSLPGDLPGSDPPGQPDVDNHYRMLYTNLPGEVGTQAFEPLTPLAAERLAERLEVPAGGAAEALINSVRGRSGCTVDNPAGHMAAPVRLWGISRSAPVLVGRSPVLAQPEVRDRLVYVGAADGMLHAIHAGAWDPAAGRYRKQDPAAGTELWAYLPGSLLPALRQQPFADPEALPVVHLDGTPVVGDFFLALEEDGRRRWRTLLAASATILPLRQSCLFVIDVTDPYQPRLLWEQLLPGGNSGTTRGLAVGLGTGTGAATPALYLSTSLATGIDREGHPDAQHGHHGLQIMALDLVTGAPLWQFIQAYGDIAGGITVAPAVPALLDADADGRIDYVVCGDLAGQLWVLHADSGQPLGGAPVYVVPGGATEPIGASVTVRGHTAYFGTGGADHADPVRGYALYAVELLPEGGRLLWRLPLEAGEQVWQAPLLDRSGNLLLGTAFGYRRLADPTGPVTTGRLLLVAADGAAEVGSVLAAGAIARTVAAAGRAITVAVTGEVSQFGRTELLDEPAETLLGALRIWSWRLR